jgi:phosphoribosyl 1,2-cyclic phosphodiesterase
MHTSLLVSYRAANVMIDARLDWLGKLKRVGPGAIVLTHAHPDHARVLKRGAPCPVYAPEKAWQQLQQYPVKDRHVIKERTPAKICGITFEAFPVEHSILSPAFGYRVSAGRARIFYAPDLIGSFTSAMQRSRACKSILAMAPRSRARLFVNREKR